MRLWKERAEARKKLVDIQEEFRRRHARGEISGLDYLEIDRKIDRTLNRNQPPTSAPVEKERGQKNTVSGQFESNRRRH